METRINILSEKCHNALDGINKLHAQAQEFPKRLNCEPSEMKTRFLDGMKELDEYLYVLTDINLSLQNFIVSDQQSESDSSPVLDANRMHSPLQPIRLNLLDALSEPSTSQSIAASVQGTLRKKKTKKPTEGLLTSSFDDKLIDFSSASASVESVHNDPKPDEQVLEHNINIQQWNLPKQSILSTDTVHDVIIVNVDTQLIWVIIENTGKLLGDLMVKMKDHYKNNTNFLTINQLHKISYCAYLDLEFVLWYRCFVLTAVYKENPTLAEVYLVDTGETRMIPNEKICALNKEFCQYPPFARSCHLAGIDIFHQRSECQSKLKILLNKFVHANCKIEIDDNSSEHLEVYVTLQHGQCLNWMLVEEGLATYIDERCVQNEPVSGRMSTCKIEDLTDVPEHEDALVAVTGYHNRDEMDICKHYDPTGPSKTCFKGSRCTKRHVPMHPDGWTTDRVEVCHRVPSMPLPRVGERCRVRVTYVHHFNRFFVQFVHPENTDSAERQRPFGMMAPATTLEELIRQMNSRAVLASYRPLQLIPACGELVAALYPIDGKWYRARMLETARLDQAALVQYIDYGTEGWVTESMVSVLEPRFRTLPCQSVACTLLDVRPRSTIAPDIKTAKEALTRIAQDKVHEILVLSHSLDELEVSLFDHDNISVSEKFAATGLVNYLPCSVDYKIHTKRTVVP